jgi:hypothetical protein
MKSQRIVKSGAATGGAVVLLLISALLAPSPALAATGKLLSTGVEPGASGQARVTNVSVVTGAWNPFYEGTMTVTCKGLTPGQGYGIQADDGHRGGGGASGVANARGELKVTFPVSLNKPWCYVSVGALSGTVLGGDVRL